MLIELQRALQRILTAPDPAAALARELAVLPPGDRVLLERVDPDGLRLSALLVNKLRFERATGADEDLERDFDQDPGGFTEEFRRYLQETTSRAFIGSEEAEAFRSWRTLHREKASPSGSREGGRA